MRAMRPVPGHCFRPPERGTVTVSLPRQGLGIFGGVLALLLVMALGLATESRASAQAEVTSCGEPAGAFEEGGVCREPESASSPRRSVREHAVAFSLGLGVPAALGGVSQRAREAVFLVGARGEGSSSALGSVVVAYRRALLDVRLDLQARVLSISDGTPVTVRDGVESQKLALEAGGGYMDLAALAGLRWEPQLYGAEDGGEGLALSLSALGGLSVVNLWGRFQPEQIPNFRLGERAFHWTVVRQRFDGELALRWRHYVGGASPEHLLGMEVGVLASLFVHIPYLSHASEPIGGAREAWGSVMAFARLTWELGLVPRPRRAPAVLGQAARPSR